MPTRPRTPSSSMASSRGWADLSGDPCAPPRTRVVDSAAVDGHRCSRSRRGSWSCFKASMLKSMPVRWLLIYRALLVAVAFSPVPKPHSPGFWMSARAPRRPAAVVAGCCRCRASAVVAAPPPAVVADEDPELSPTWRIGACQLKRDRQDTLHQSPSRVSGWRARHDPVRHCSPHTSPVAGRTVQRRAAVGNHVAILR